MNISRKKFVLLFIVCAFVFMFITNALFGTEARPFPWHEKTFLGTDSPVAWKSAGYKIAYPIKFVLVAPTLPFPNFLHEDPPPPLVGTFFALYWAILALVIYYIIAKIKNSGSVSSTP